MANLKRVHIITFGCQMNKYNSNYLETYLLNQNFIITKQIKNADIILLNTCSVRERAEHKIYSYLELIKTIKKQRPDVIIGVGGCVAQQEGYTLLKKIPYLNLVFGNFAIKLLPKLIKKVEQGSRIVSIPDKPDYPYHNISKNKTNSSYKLKALVTIITGCNNFCSYCIVPYVRGREISRPAKDIKNEIIKLVENGTREVTLIGQNVNAYYDQQKNLNFAGLLESISKIKKLWRIRFTTNHPKNLSLRLIQTIANIENVMKQIHIPVQSGSNSILQNMRRGYNRSDYLYKLEKIKKILPSLSLSSDIIVGFPGETDKDFSDTLSLLDEANYDFIFNFIYSDRPYTWASNLSNKIELKIKINRLKELQNKQREITLKHYQRLEGKITEILVDKPAKKDDGYMSGQDQTGRIVNFIAPSNLIGRLVNVKIIKGLPSSLIGQLISIK